MRFVTSSRVELVCACFSLVGAVILIAATFASLEAYVNCPGSSCALYADFSPEKGPTCGNKAACDLAMFFGFASLVAGLLFVVQITCVMRHGAVAEQPGKSSWLRHILSLKMLLALFFVLGLFAIAVVTSVGAAVYCEHQKAVWKEANETVTYPGCQEYDRWVAQLPGSGWPSNGFVTMQAMMAGVWLSFVFWLSVFVVTIVQYLQRQQLARSSQFTKLKDSAHAVTSYSSNNLI